MERAGIGDECVVVAYDDAAGSIAARLWWMLSALGIRVAVLDGGISAWFGELSIDVPAAPENVTFTPKPWPLDQVVDAVAVDALRRGDSVTVLDARSAERFAGVPNPVDKRFGHIPGALNAPWGENINPETGKFRSVGELRERFTRVGVRSDRPAVCHCGSGVTACHNLLAMAVAKLPAGSLYPGSWSDWSADEGRPIDEVVAPYFDEIIAAARSGLFDTIGHLDVVKRYLYPLIRPADFGARPELLDPALAAIAESGMALEINTSGLRHRVAETYPAPWALARFRELGGVHAVTGSDAHRADWFAWGLADGYRALTEAGFPSLAFRRGMDRVLIDLP